MALGREAARASALLRRGECDPAAGHAVIDAMVAMLIISMTMILSFRVIDQANRTASVAGEVQEAERLIQDLMLTGPRSFDVSEGVAGDFTWIVSTQAVGEDRPIELCRRHVQVVNRVSSRRFAASTLETCPEVAQ